MPAPVLERMPSPLINPESSRVVAAVSTWKLPVPSVARVNFFVLVAEAPV